MGSVFRRVPISLRSELGVSEGSPGWPLAVQKRPAFGLLVFSYLAEETKDAAAIQASESTARSIATQRDSQVQRDDPAWRSCGGSLIPSAEISFRGTWWVYEHRALRANRKLKSYGSRITMLPG
jgi:hypothetical protein